MVFPLTTASNVFWPDEYTATRCTLLPLTEPEIVPLRPIAVLFRTIGGARVNLLALCRR
jgi:hypothetical protein